jgi:hypothetical protein
MSNVAVLQQTDTILLILLSYTMKYRAVWYVAGATSTALSGEYESVSSNLIRQLHTNQQ